LLLNKLCSTARSAIREKIIPHAVSWFTGEAQDEDYDGTILEDDENNSEDEEDDYDEDDEEDEEDE
jgi:nucleosome assembly protein 1-like 1